MSKTAVKHLLKIGISLALLAYTIHCIDWRNSLALAKRADLWMMLGAVVLLTVERALSVLKWLILIRVKGALVTFWRLFVINYIGGFWGMFLPSSLSTDIVRGYYLSKATADLSLAVTSLLVDHVMGILALLTLGCVSAWMVGDQFGLTHPRLWVAACALLLIIAAALFFNPRFMAWANRSFIRRFGTWRLTKPLGRLLAACADYRRYPGVLVLSLGGSIVVQVLRVLVFYVVALGFGVQVSLFYYFMFIPLIMVLIMLPISINGIGIREGSFVYFFSLVNVPAAEAFVVSFAVSLLTTLTTAVGGLIYLFDRHAAKPIACSQSPAPEPPAVK